MTTAVTKGTLRLGEVGPEISGAPGTVLTFGADGRTLTGEPVPVTPPTVVDYFDIDIRQFGAVEGGADTSAKIIDAYNALLAQGKGRLIIPGGVWGMGAELDINAPNIQIVGGRGSKLLKLGTDHHVLNLGTAAQNCMVTGLEIDGNNEPQGSLILCRGGNNLIFANYLHNNGDVLDPTPYANGSHGVCLDGQVGGACSHNLVFGNRIVDNHDIGVSQHTAPDNEIASNRIIGNGLEGVTIDVTSHRARVHFNRVEFNCRIDGVGGIGVDGSDLWEVVGNQITGTQNGRAGLKTQNNTGPSNYFILNSNLFLDNGGWGVWLFNGTSGGSANGTLLGNVIRGNPTGSIRFDANSDNNTCVGNSVNGVAPSNGGAGNSIANNV
jgi:hypothetical protein